MPAFNDAVAVNLAAGPLSDQKKIYEGRIDPTWNILNVPCGGYALALILQACIQYQSTTAHVDPLHISAHFLRPTTPNAPFRVFVQTLKTGKGFTNLVAEFYQEDALRITSHAIFGANGPTPSDPLNFTLQPPSPYARRHPLHLHPSQGTIEPLRSVWVFKDHVSWSYDPHFTELNKPTHPSRVNPPAVGGSGLEWGGYLQFNTPTERLSNAYIPFLADMFLNTINLLPESEYGGTDGGSWFPTMTLAIEFKFPVSMLSPEKHSMRTVALYSSGKFVNHPQQRHDVYVEVWTAPSNIGEGPIKEGWRDEQICLATATQMALAVPVEINMKNGQRKPKL